MKILSIIHGEGARTELFGPVVEQRGHRIEEWSLAWRKPPPRPLDDYEAVMVFGGAMHADEDEHHPWLREENLMLQELLDRHVPVLGVCLGAQLLAKAAHAEVYRAEEPEIGWYEVELTDAARGDALFGRLPQAFPAFQWHYYTFDVPAGGVELARSSACTQAFRLGEGAWGVQFHPEVTETQIRTWLTTEGKAAGVAVKEVADATNVHIGDWNRLGRRLCGAWLDAAERVAAPV